MANDVLIIATLANAEALSESLRAEGFVVERETNCLTGVERALSENFTLIILEASPLASSGISVSGAPQRRTCRAAWGSQKK